MAHRKVNSPEHLKNGEFFLRHPLKIAQICFFSYFFLHIPIDLWVEASENLIFRLKVLSRVRTVRPKLGVFSKMFKIQLFCCFITQLVKMLQQWSLCDVIEDILPFVQPENQIF